MKPGHNNPCPCGSGRKYKHCCLIAEAAPPAGPADLTWHRLRAQLDGFATEMLRFTNHSYGPSALHEAWDAFTCFDGIAFDPDTPLIQLFMPWFFHFWTPDPEDTEVVQGSTASSPPRHISPPERGGLTRLCAAIFSRC